LPRESSTGRNGGGTEDRSAPLRDSSGKDIFPWKQFFLGQDESKNGFSDVRRSRTPIATDQSLILQEKGAFEAGGSGYGSFVQARPASSAS